MTDSKLRVVGSGRRARRGEAQRHEAAFQRAGELLVLAESFERQPKPDRPEGEDSGGEDSGGEDSGPQTSTEEAESVKADAVAAANRWLEAAYNRAVAANPSGGSYSLAHQTLMEIFNQTVDVRPVQDDLKEFFRALNLAYGVDELPHASWKLTHLRPSRAAILRKKEKQLDAARALREELNQPEPDEIETAPDDRGARADELTEANRETAPDDRRGGVQELLPRLQDLVKQGRRSTPKQD